MNKVILILNRLISKLNTIGTLNFPMGLRNIKYMKHIYIAISKEKNIYIYIFISISNNNPDHVLYNSNINCDSLKIKCEKSYKPIYLGAQLK